MRPLPLSSRLAWIVFCLLALAVGTIAVIATPNRIAPAPRAGFVDLSRWDFARDGPAQLAGDWLYFDERWASGIGDGRTGGVSALVPGAWPASNRDGTLRGNGFGTYTLTLTLPAISPRDAFGIDTGQLYSAYRLYANDKLIAGRGTPAASASGERADSYSSLGVLSPGSRIVQLRLEVSNHLFDFGGFFAVPSVGLANDLAHRRHWTEMLMLIVIGALMFAACYHFAFHGIAGGGQAHLWFGTLAALLALRDSLFEPLAQNIVPLIGQDWVWRIDFAATALAVPAAYWFLALSFGRHLSPRFGIGLSALCAAAALTIVLFGPVVGGTVIKFVEALAVVTIVYLTYAIVRSVWDGEKGAALALVGWLLIAAAVVHDILLDNQVIAGGSLLQFGCIAFFLCLSGVLTARSHAAFERAELLSAELKRLNAGLEIVVGERTVELRHKILELETKQIAVEQSREAAVAANETKSRFLANMSHELRTPLNAILGFSEIIHKRILGDDLDRYGDYAKDIHSSGRHLLSLIDDILDLSTVEAGKRELRGVRLGLNAQIDAALRLVESRAAAKSIRLAFRPAEALDVVADERALQQILINLLTNAVKFTQTGGDVSVQVYRNAEGAIVVAIEDTGSGIKPEDMAHVLESFGRGRHDIAAADERGTGLGLPIVKALVEAHGGTFELESTCGIGTTAFVSFPVDHSVAFDSKRRQPGATTA